VSGTTETSGTTGVAEKNSGVTFATEKVLTREDESILWTASLEVRLNLRTGRTSASWVSAPGSDLEATGRLRGVPIVIGKSSLDIYRGRVSQAAP
jgi:hypothetical protein